MEGWGKIGVQSASVLYPNSCYNELCYIEVQVYLKLTTFPKKSVTVACFFVSDRLSVINYNNNTIRQISLPVLALSCHFKFLLLLAMSQRSFVNCDISKKMQS